MFMVAFEVSLIAKPKFFRVALLAEKICKVNTFRLILSETYNNNAHCLNVSNQEGTKIPLDD